MMNVVRNVLALAIFWILGFVLVRALPETAGQAGQLIASIVGVGIALWLRALPAAYLTAAIAAVMASEGAIGVYYGRTALHGAPVHFAVLGAGVLGVLFGALLMAKGPRLMARRAAAQDASAPSAALPRMQAS